MSRRTLLAECRRAAPGYDWTHDLGRLPTTTTATATVRVALMVAPRNGKPALWHAEAIERESKNEHHRNDYGRPLRFAGAQGENLKDAIETAVAALETGR